VRFLQGLAPQALHFYQRMNDSFRMQAVVRWWRIIYHTCLCIFNSLNDHNSLSLDELSQNSLSKPCHCVSSAFLYKSAKETSKCSEKKRQSLVLPSATVLPWIYSHDVDSKWTVRRYQLVYANRKPISRLAVLQVTEALL
jgi:hypothetical protein